MFNSGFPLSKSFYIPHNSKKTKIAVADLSLLSESYGYVEDELLPEQLSYIKTLQPEYYAWYYFNRINVPFNFQPKNAGVLLMLNLIKWADTIPCIIINDVNPYHSTHINQKELIKFEKLFGFMETKRENLLIRFSKGLTIKKPGESRAFVNNHPINGASQQKGTLL